MTLPLSFWPSVFTFWGRVASLFGQILLAISKSFHLIIHSSNSFLGWHSLLCDVLVFGDTRSICLCLGIGACCCNAVVVFHIYPVCLDIVPLIVACVWLEFYVLLVCVRVVSLWSLGNVCNSLWLFVDFVAHKNASLAVMPSSFCK